MARFQRDRSKERFWRRAVRQWRQSGQSIRAFCRERGLSEPSFHGWRRTLAERDRATDQASQATRLASKRQKQEQNGRIGRDRDFVPVQVVASATPSMTPATAPAVRVGSIELVLGAGRVVRVPAGFDAATLQRLLAVLEDRPC